MPNKLVKTVENQISILFVDQDNLSEISHIAIYFRSGSSSDPASMHGITHLIEHMLFKGSRTRNYLDIIATLESNGCDINAYTTKESMVVHASFLNEFAEEIIEILGDIISNPVFPEDELKKEKSVIIDEIRMYRDTPGEKIYDDFEAMMFKGSSLAHEITGTISSVKSITGEMLSGHYENIIRPGYFVAVKSSIPQKQIEKLIDHNFTPTGNILEIQPEIPRYLKKAKIQYDDNSQIHIILGSNSYPVSHPLRPTASLLANYLGGAAMSSYLNLIMREQMGLTYSVETSMNNFSNTGIFYTYFTCDAQKANVSLKTLKKIYDELFRKGMSDAELQKAKRQLKGQIAIHFESGLSWTLFMAKYFHYYKTTISFTELLESIENINLSQMNEVISQHLDFNCLSSITVKKKKNE